jgi:hypothetical protein
VATTYTDSGPIAGRKFTCKRCAREYPYPQPGERPIRCECGWWYTNDRGRIVEEFRPRIDGHGGIEET